MYRLNRGLITMQNYDPPSYSLMGNLLFQKPNTINNSTHSNSTVLEFTKTAIPELSHNTCSTYLCWHRYILPVVEQELVQ